MLSKECDRVSKVVCGIDKTISIVTTLIYARAIFKVIPLPNDDFRIESDIKHVKMINKG
jgi:hypothetical protein